MKAFCAGAHLQSGLASGADFAADEVYATLESQINPLMKRLRQLDIPWVSAVRGPAAGVGCSLTIAADIVLANETACFLQAFVRTGLVPDGGSSRLLKRDRTHTGHGNDAAWGSGHRRAGFGGGRIFFEELLPRLESVALDGGAKLSHSCFVNGPKSLPIRFAMR